MTTQPTAIDIGCHLQYDDDLPAHLHQVAFAFHAETCGLLGDGCFVTTNRTVEALGYHLKVTVDFAHGDAADETQRFWLGRIAARLDPSVWQTSITSPHHPPFMLVRYLQ